MIKIEIILRLNTPRHRSCPIQIITGYPIFGRPRLEHLQLAELFIKPIHYFLRGVQFFKSLLKPVEVRRVVVFGKAQLFLDHLHLLSQKKLSLVCRNLFIHLSGDLTLQLCHLPFTFQELQYNIHPRRKGQRFQHCLQTITAGGGKGGGKVGKEPGLIRVKLTNVLLELLAIKRIQWQ